MWIPPLFSHRLPLINKEKKRNPGAHQIKKRNTWYFSYKALVGVNKDSGLVHAVEATPANVHDVSQTSSLLTGKKGVICGNSGYLGAQNRNAIIRNISKRKIKYKINWRPSQVKKLSKSSLYAAKKAEYKSLLFVQRWSMYSESSKGSCVLTKRGTEGRKSSGPNSILAFNCQGVVPVLMLRLNQPAGNHLLGFKTTTRIQVRQLWSHLHSFASAHLLLMYPSICRISNDTVDIH